VHHRLSLAPCRHAPSKRLIPDVTPSFTGASNLGFRWKICSVMSIYLGSVGRLVGTLTCGKFQKLERFKSRRREFDETVCDVGLAPGRED
jgi:hypothetical protein